MSNKDLSIDIRGGNAYAYKTDSRWYQLWRFNNGCLVNEQKQVLALQSATDSENRQIVREARNDKIHQKWKIVYVDTSPEVPTSGFSKDWGMWINRPFHVVTQMTSHRYLDLIGANAVIKTPNGFDSQVFFFDYKTRTIKSQKTKTLSLDIRSTTLYAYATNSAWY